jgi:membrane-associated protein
MEFFLNIDAHLAELVSTYEVWTYAILFLIIFLETGIVVMPFLPGDSLLFAVGAIAARGLLRIEFVLPLLIIAAILGDSVNYWIGSKFGPAVLVKDLRWLKKSHLQRAHAFYEKHGGKAIVLARFFPILRTFAPFVAGVASMNYRAFILFNIVGGVVWTSSFLLLGYFFGNIPVVEKHFSLVVVGVIVFSLIPVGIEAIRALRHKPLLK